MRESHYGVIDFASYFQNDKCVTVKGNVVSDAKFRTYEREYKAQWVKNSDRIRISRSDGNGDSIEFPHQLPITSELIAFFGMYSGDGSKGTETSQGSGKIKLHRVSYEAREVNMVKFVVEQFRYLFGDSVNFSFSLGDDSVLFYEGEFYNMLLRHYGGKIPPSLPLPKLSAKDKQYLSESRDYQTNSNEDDLRFYYTHKDAMKKILTQLKCEEFEKAGISLRKEDTVTASLRRPFKKGSRAYGKGSRSDGMAVKGTNGLGELFLFLMHSIEESILNDKESSSGGIVKWDEKPSKLGEVINTSKFFKTHPYGKVCGERPLIKKCLLSNSLVGKWPRSSEVRIANEYKISPKLCYVSGLYLAEGTGHDKMLTMYHRKETGFSFSFTSSEDHSLNLVISQIEEIINDEVIVSTWKVKVGSQYFTELVSISNKINVPMLRGGGKGQGKLRSLEMSLSIRDWAVNLCPTLIPYSSRFTHVEPTGAGVARIDFSCPSPFCKWLFPIFMASVFSNYMPNPEVFV